MITATTTVDDYIAAHRLHYRRQFAVFCGIWSSILLIGIVMAWTTSLKAWAPILVCVGLGGLLGQWWDSRIGLPRKVRKLYAQYREISAPSEMAWDEDSVEGRSAHGYGKRKWSDYVRFLENDEVFLLYVTDQLWHAFPKHNFSQAQIEEFRRLARKAGQKISP